MTFDPTNYELGDFETLLFCWHDKVDKTYMDSTLRTNRSVRNMSRGYLNEFEVNKKMNPAEFELCVVGIYNERFGTLIPFDAPVVINPLMVYPTQEGEN